MPNKSTSGTSAPRGLVAWENKPLSEVRRAAEHGDLSAGDALRNAICGAEGAALVRNWKGGRK